MQGLVSAEDAEIRRRVLTKLENEQGLTLKKLVDDCQRVVSVKSDSEILEESGVAHIKKTKNKPTLYSPQKEKSKIKRPHIYNNQSTNRRKNPRPGPCSVKKKNCKNCGKVGHKVTRWYAKKMRKPRNKIKLTQSGDNEDGNLRKYVMVKIFNKTVKFKLDSGSDLSIINLHTWRRLNKPSLLNEKDMFRDSINIFGEVVLSVTLNVITKKLKVYVL